jgi:hypothetical protein
MQASANGRRFEIPYFEGINSLVAYNIAKKQELAHAENVRSAGIGTMDKREGIVTIGNSVPVLGDYGLFYFPNSCASSQFLYRIAEPGAGGGSTIYHLSLANAWTPLVGLGAGITNGYFDGVIAEGCLFLVNYNANNRYISTDGTTVVDSTSTAGHLYNTPKANCISYYKGRLWLADYAYGTGSVRYKTNLLHSSYPLGMVTMISGDPAAPYTACDVTDTKYVYTTAPGNTLDVYRASAKVATITITGATGLSLVMTTAFEAGYTSLKSSDQLWAPGSYLGPKQWRWVSNPSESGSSGREYDSQRLAGGDGSPITMLETVGNVLMAANSNTIGIWNDYVMQYFDFNIGCVSRKGYVKNMGALYFLHYTGIYATNGEAPKLISSKAERYILGATKAGKEGCSAGKKNRSLFFTLGDVTLYRPDGSPEKVLNDVVLEYIITQEDWYVHTGVKATDFETFVDTANTDRLIMTTTFTDRRTAEFLSGETDLGSEIIMRAETPAFTLSGQFEKFVYPLEVVLEVERGSGIKVFVSLDRGPFYELEGEATKGSTILKIQPLDGNDSIPVRCRNIRLAFSHANSQLVKIARAAITFNPSAEEEPTAPNKDAT